MNVLVLGDIHGCYHTFKELTDNYWNKDQEFLVLVGDLVNKGLHSAETLRYFWKLKEKYPYQVYLVRGNNEQYILESYKNKSKSKWYLQLKAEITKHDIPISEMAEWIESTPLKWETPHILITHAGIAKGEKNPFYITNPKSVLNNRAPLKNIGKIQVHGHDMIKSGNATYNKLSHSWNIDTGVWAGNMLTGIKLNRKGKLIDVIETPTHPLDIVKPTT